jgi:AraC family transcriptional regulator
MDWTTRLTQAIDYLEGNLENEAEVERAASLANCSLFHFSRMFEVVFGVSPAEYVRRRRLSRAALDLATGDAKVIDVALRYGWETPESFAKAFKRCFGITPSEARLPGVTLETWPSIRLAVILKGDQSMKYRIVEKDGFSVTGFEMRTTNTENQETGCIAKLWERLIADGTLETMGKSAGPMGMLGICHDFRPSNESFAYAVCVETPKGGTGSFPSGFREILIPKATYVIFEADGPIPASIAEVWKNAYAEWFPSSEYEHAGTPDFEAYLGDPGKVRKCEVWIPIKKKARP